MEGTPPTTTKMTTDRGEKEGNKYVRVKMSWVRKGRCDIRAGPGAKMDGLGGICETWSVTVPSVARLNVESSCTMLCGHNISVMHHFTRRDQKKASPLPHINRMRRKSSADHHYCNLSKLIRRPSVCSAESDIEVWTTIT